MPPLTDAQREALRGAFPRLAADMKMETAETQADKFNTDDLPF